MGKGQRARDIRAQDKIDNPQKYTAKKKKTAKKKAWVTPLVTALIVVLIVGIFALTYLNDSGIILRGKTTMETENFKVTGTMMQYATMSTYQNFVNQYSSIIQYFGLDTTRSLASQEYGDGTWLDYFRDSAETSLQTSLVYAEAAKTAGVELDEDELQQIEDSVASLKDAAAANGYTEKAYLAMLFGKGVNKDDIRDFYKLTMLASKYETQIADEIEEAVTDEEIADYYKENIDTYSLADIITYSDTLTLDVSLSAEEKAAQKAEFLAKFDAMAAASTEEEFKAALEAYLTDAGVEDVETELESASSTTAKSGVTVSDAADWIFELVDSAYVRADGEVKVFTEDDEAEEAEDDTADDTADTTEDEAADTAEDTAEDTAADTAEDTEAEPAAQSEDEADDNSGEIDASELTGDSEETDDTTEVEYTVSVYYIVRAPYADESETKNAGHILISFNNYASEDEAKAEADAVYAEYLAGEQTKESFEALAEANTDDSGVFYDNIKTGDMVENFENWVFDEARQVGDTEIVETEYGYHIMYFVGEGLPSWEAQCLIAIVGDKTGDRYTEFEEQYPVTVNESAMKAVKG